MSVQHGYPPYEPNKMVGIGKSNDRGVKQYVSKVLLFWVSGVSFWPLAIACLLVCTSCAKNPPLIEVPKWGNETAQPGQPITISFNYQGMREGELMHLTITQLNPNDTSVLVESVDIPLSRRKGSVEYTWHLPESVIKNDSTKDISAQKNAYRYVVKATASGLETETSPELLIHVNYVLKVHNEQGLPVKDGIRVWLITSDGGRHEAYVDNGLATFLDVSSGPAQLIIEDHLHKTDQSTENR